MKAIIIQGAEQVAVEERPRPTIVKDTDVIIKTRYAGLCGELITCNAYPGSDLHNYRQTEEGTGFVLGHEVVGEIVEVGSAVKKFQVGDVVAAPFASCCGESSRQTANPRRMLLLRQRVHGPLRRCTMLRIAQPPRMSG